MEHMNQLHGYSASNTLGNELGYIDQQQVGMAESGSRELLSTLFCFLPRVQKP